MPCKSSFASMDTAVSLTGMEYGGITPIGLPASWPILVDQNVVERQRVIIGSGVRGSKLLASSEILAALPGAEVLTITKNASVVSHYADVHACEYCDSAGRTGRRWSLLGMERGYEEHGSWMSPAVRPRPCSPAEDCRPGTVLPCL